MDQRGYCDLQDIKTYVKTYVGTGTPGRTSYRPATTSSFSMTQLISIKMTLHGEESTLISEEGISRR